MKKNIAQVVVGLPVEGPFDYIIPAERRALIQVGQRVRIVFNRRICLGIVVAILEDSAFTHKKLSSILELLESFAVISSSMLALCHAMSQESGCSWGEVVVTYLPRALRKAKRAECEVPFTNSLTMEKAKGAGLGAWLRVDLARYRQEKFLSSHIQSMVEKGLDVIVLVPEVSLVGQVHSKLMKVAPELAERMVCLDRRQTAKVELAHWMRIRQVSGCVVIGTRSAVFAPVCALGLMVVFDEEHDAYKQEQVPYYRASQVALRRVRFEHARIMMLTAAPSAETWARAHEEDWRVDIQSEKAPALQLVDMTNYNPQKTSVISFPLQNAIESILDQQGKVLIYINRRGFNTLTSCQQCGHHMTCPRCDVNLTLLSSGSILACRHCTYRAPLPRQCPKCHGAYLYSKGRGIEKLEGEVRRRYKQAHIGRYEQGSRAYPHKADIVIATQAVFNQIDLKVDLVAVIDYDAALHHIDFRCAQKAFTLLMRLRALACDKLLVQTYMIESYCLQQAKVLGFDDFYAHELKIRQDLGLPPYKHMVAIGLRGKQEELVWQQCLKVYQALEKDLPAHIELLDPHPDVNPKLRDQYRYTVLLKGASLEKMLRWIKVCFKTLRISRQIIKTMVVDP